MHVPEDRRIVDWRVTLLARGAAAWLVVVGAIAIAGCAAIGGDGVVPASAMSLAISNQTTIPVALFVNGTMIETVNAVNAEQGIPANQLPALPWKTEVRTVSGRVLLRLTVHAGDVIERLRSDGTGSSKGDGARVDLSCGRIDLWSGPPMLGPMPGPGTPGDCDP